MRLSASSGAIGARDGGPSLRLGRGIRLQPACAPPRWGTTVSLSLKALLVNQEEAHFKVPVPTLALSGEQDGCIASDVFEQLTVAEDFPQASLFVASWMPGTFFIRAPRHRECVDT